MSQILFHLQQLYDQIPGWVITGVASGFTAMAGLAAKFCWDWLMEKRELRHTRVTKLEKFSAMLAEGKQLYAMQNKLADSLARTILTRTKAEGAAPNNEALFSSNYTTLTESELETHAMIRAITLNSLKRIVGEVLAWIDENPEFKNNSIFALKKNVGAELAKKIISLELHLNLWEDKFSVWIPDHEKHALVSIGEDVITGTPYPVDVQATIAEAIAKIK